MQCPQFCILTKASWRNLAIKGGMSIFHILRVFSMGHDFFSKVDSTFLVFREQYLRCFCFVYAEDPSMFVAETISYHKCCHLFFNQMPGIMLIFHLQRKISEFHFPFTCNRYGRCFGISVYALDFQPRDPWFESGCLQTIFFFTFFSLLTFHCTISFDYIKHVDSQIM